MALHEGKEAKKHEEHARKMMHRKRGGEVEHEGEKEEPEDEDQDEEVHAENKEAGPKESPGRKHGGKMPEHRQKRKAGGAVKGEKPKHRPDRRARGGAMGADLHPETAAGHMSAPSFERVGPKPDEGGKGMDSR